MALNINIKYKDSQNWTNDNSEIINWSSYHQTFKAERTQQNYLAPIRYTDTWLKDHDVQHVRFDAWRLEFTGKESELQELSRMQSCDSIIIEDIEHGLTHTVNMQISEWLDFAEPERQSDTANWRLVLIYRTNKTIINKFDGLSNQVTIIGSGTYYSKYAKIAFKSPLEEIKVPWSDGLVLIESTLRTGFQVLFYLSDSELETFKDDYYTNSLTIDAVAVEEVQELEINPLGEDNYKVVATFITDITSTDQTPAANVVDLLTGSTHYYSNFAKLPYIGELEETKILWGEDGDKLLSERNRIGFRILYYFTSSELETFKNDWNQDNFTIDAVTILEKITLETTQLESGNYQVIASCVTQIDTVNKTTGLATADTLQVNSNPYLTVFDKITINEVAEQITFPWSDGSQRILREINNIGYKFLFYFNEFGKETFKNDFNNYPAVVLPSSAVIEKRPLEITEDTTGFYQIIASVVTSVAQNTYDLDPLNTHNIDIDSGTFYYTDYPIISSIQDTQLSQSSNEDGVNITSKAITRDVKLVKLFLDEADTYALKEGFEKSTDIEVDGVTVLENRIVSVSELAYDLYEVNVECLTVAAVTYPL